MMIRSTMAVIATLSLLGSTLVAPSPSWAKGGKPGKVEVRAALDPCCGNPEPEAEGKAERKVITKNGTVLTDQFKASVEIPIPSPGLGITDPTTADIRLVLSRAGADYAECFLVLDDEEANSAEFQVKVMSLTKKSGQVVHEIEGQCDIDLAQSGVQSGVPDVQAGDVATVRVVNATSIDFLQGTFQTH